MLIVNFKNYVFGQKTLDLVRLIDIYCNKAVVAVPHTDIKEIVKNTTIPVYAQHVDQYEQGRATGFILPESLISAGAAGSLLNHSEHKLKFKVMKETIERCLDLGFKLIVCASTLKEAQKIKALKPFAIAFEDPALVATGKAISTHNSNEVKEFVSMLDGSGIIPLCGAGISNSDDVKAALALGCKGILVASAVANSQAPEKFLKEIAGLF